MYADVLVSMKRSQEWSVEIQRVLDPGFASARMGLWGAYYRKGMHADALAEAGKFFGVLGDHELEDALRRYTPGGYSRAMRFGAEVLAKRSARCHLPGVRIA